MRWLWYFYFGACINWQDTESLLRKDQKVSAILSGAVKDNRCWLELNGKEQIDQVDKELIDLLVRRLALVSEVGEVKSQHGLPIYAPDREAAMLTARRAEAEKQGVPADLIEDILRRVMRESNFSENDSGF